MRVVLSTGMLLFVFAAFAAIVKSGRSSLTGNVKLSIALNPAAPPSSISTVYNTATLKMATLDGTHCLPVTERVGNDNIPYLLKWDNLSGVTAISLPNRILGGGTNDLKEPIVEFVDSSRVLIASCRSTGGPIRVTEYGLTNNVLTLALDVLVGDTRNRVGSSCVLDNGEVAFAFNYQDPTDEENEFFFKCEVAWRTVESASTNHWITESFDIPTLTVDSANPTFMSMAPGADGRAYLFWHMDTQGERLGMARFELFLGEITLVDNTFIEQGLGINGENPRITAVRDNDRVIAMYQDFQSTFYQECGVYSNTPASDAITIAGIETDLSTNLVASLPWPSLHINYPVLCAWPRTNGIYFFVDHFETCTNKWRSGRFDYTTGVHFSQVATNGHVRSRSDDGYYMFETATGVRSLNKMQFN